MSNRRNGKSVRNGAPGCGPQPREFTVGDRNNCTQNVIQIRSLCNCKA